MNESFEAPVCGDDRTWWRIVLEHSERHGSATAINFDGRERLTYADLDRASASLATALAERGLLAGGVVGIVSETCLEYPVILLAVHRLGGVVVPLSTRLQPEEIDYQLRHAAAQFVFADDGHVALVGEWAVKNAATCLPIRTARTLMDASSKPPAVDVGSDDLATIMYTSGSTGHPKGVMLSHGNYVHNSNVLMQLYGYGPDDIGLSFFPLCHMNGHNYQLVTWLTAGAEVVLLPRFSASRFSEQLVAYGATITSLIATHVNMILAQPPSDTDRAHRLRMVKFGMSLEPERFVEFERRFGVELRGSYSQTELVGPVTFNPSADPRRVESIGRPVPGVELRIVDERGQDVPRGHSGELLVRPAGRHGVCLGYFGEEGRPANLLPGRWWRTLDLARVDVDGFVYFTGRVKDMIKRGGFNVAAAEVERVLVAHPAVAEAAVIGVPDPVRDEAIKALVIPAHSNVVVDVRDLERFCADRLAAYKVPESFLVVADLPRTDVGKVDKRRCRELFGSGVAL